MQTDYGTMARPVLVVAGDQDPARVAEMQRATWAYVRSALFSEDDAWQQVVDGLANDENAFARIRTK